MKDIGQHIQTYCSHENEYCGENFVRASNSYVTLCNVKRLSKRLDAKEVLLLFVINEMHFLNAFLHFFLFLRQVLIFVSNFHLYSY